MIPCLGLLFINALQQSWGHDMVWRGFPSELSEVSDWSINSSSTWQAAHHVQHCSEALVPYIPYFCRVVRVAALQLDCLAAAK